MAGPANPFLETAAELGCWEGLQGAVYVGDKGGSSGTRLCYVGNNGGSSGTPLFAEELKNPGDCGKPKVVINDGGITVVYAIWEIPNAHPGGCETKSRFRIAEELVPQSLFLDCLSVALFFDCSYFKSNEHTIWARLSC